jgi:UrcA family protein
MNIHTNPLGRVNRQIALRAIALIALLAIAPLAAMADQRGPVLETRTAKVSLAGLDLATPDGVAAARDRLHETALLLCAQVGDTRSIARHANFVRCVDETFANAMQKVTGPALAAVEKSRSAR